MEPFGFQRGTIRACIVLVLSFGMIPVAIWANSDALAGFTGIAGFAIRDYFAHREEENRAAGPVLPDVHVNGDDAS